jgi:membrane-associated protease RseP (regulator of RpoE activity)
MSEATVVRPADPGTPPAPAEGGDQRAALIRLLVVIAAIVAVSAAAGVGKTVIVIAAILLMIVLHELGHFVMAKLAGIKVTEFFVGFGTRLWSFRRGETEYGVKVLPFGGYVKIIGMNNVEQVDPTDEARTYRQQPFWRRISVAVAGSAMHFLIALVLLFLVFFVVGDQNVLRPTPATGARVVEVDALTSGPSPAQQAGFQVGDQVQAVNGTVFQSLNDLIDFIHQHPEQTLDFAVKRAGQVVHLTPHTVDLSKVQAEGSAAGPAPTANQPTGFIGFVLNGQKLHFGFFESISRAGGSFVDLGAKTFAALGGLVSAHGVSSYAHMLVDKKAANDPNAVRFQSPVGIVRLASQASHNGLEESLFLLILINIFVGIFNLLPLLPLDGGHVAIAIYERLRSRKGRPPYHADVAKLMPVVYATFAVIVFIGVSALFLDLRDVLSVVRF